MTAALGAQPDRDEGVIKYQGHWQQGPTLPYEVVAPLMVMRDRLFTLGGIGVYQDGIGYGNISHRLSQGFVISGTQTGAIPVTQPAHYSHVTSWDIQANALHCSGPCRASSESLTHAVLYQCAPTIQAVIHIHHPQLWHDYRGVLPTTQADVPYGTPAMATEIIRLMVTSALPDIGVVVMAGHEDGILAFGSTLAIAAKRVYDIGLCPN